jgi:two-component system phosphate regulon sensor histidine kinase PhoR
MWFSPLFRRLFLALALAGVAGAAAVAWIGGARLEQHLAEEMDVRLLDAAVLLEHRVEMAYAAGRPEAELQAEIDAVQAETRTDMRLTVIAIDGQVLADSHEDPRRMDNHKSRAEIRQALDEGTGYARRVSPTLEIPMLYVARRAELDGQPRAVARAALPESAVLTAAAVQRRWMWSVAAVVMAVVLAAALAAAWYFGRPAAQLASYAATVASGESAPALEIHRRDELGGLAESLQSIARQLAARRDESRRQGEQSALLLESMVEGVVAVDARRHVLFANLHAKSRDVQDRPLWEIVRHPQVEQAVNLAFDAASPQQTEFEIRGENGRPARRLALHAGRLPGKPPQGLVIVLHDVTELRRLETLRQDFAANVSHELKTPLTAIKAYAETLLAGALHDQQHNAAFVQKIETQAGRLEQLIQDLLSLARIESGKEPLEIKRVPLAAAIEQRAAEREAAAAAKNIRLEVVPPDGPATNEPVYVLADDEALREILDNLLDNAIKYTPPGGRVTIRYRREDAQALVEVEDTGIGIAPAEQERIFERFYRIDKARSREMGGTGLGLAIVKHLVQALGGSVAVASEPGRGSTFSVRLPGATNC